VRIVVNADDYGLTPAVSRAALRAHEAGIVTTASVIVTTPSFEEAAERLRATPSLRPGLHLALIGGDRPVSDPSTVRSLVDGEGRLHRSWREYFRRAASGRIDHTEVRREFEAQHERMRGAGLAIEHLDSHQNAHLWPATGGVAASAARDWGVRAVRTPSSRSWAPAGLAVRALGTQWRKVVQRNGLVTTDDMIGLDGADRYAHRILGDLARIAADGRQRPDLVVELALHLSEPEDEALAAYEWGYDYAGALDAVLGERVATALADPVFERVTWQSLTIT